MHAPLTLTVISLGGGAEALMPSPILCLRAISSRHIPLKTPTWYDLADMDYTSKPGAVDLFCGAGGLSYGMRQAGVEILAGIDIDPACRHPFEENVKAKFYHKDVADLSIGFVESLFADQAVRVLAGCAPCQPFSSYTNKIAIREHEWQLLSKFGEIVANLRPEVVTMENVPRLERHSVFGEFLAALDDADYRYSYGVVRCAKYGIPQTRRRLVLLASTLGEINLISPTHDRDAFVTVRDSIQHLDEIKAGDGSTADHLHKSSGLSEKNLERIRCSNPGGTWRDWDAELQAACHSKKSGRSYSSVYGRMRWDKPAPTITTQFHGYGNGRFGHPTQDRAISLREGAILQTFPDDYSFVPDGEVVHIAPVARLIGNAVPVRLGRAIGSSIVAHIEGLQ